MRLAGTVLLGTMLLAAGTGFAQVPPAASGRRDPRLSGIIVTPDQRYAIFDSDGVPSTVARGMTVGAWTIVGITEHAVEVEGPAGKAIIVPDAMAPTSPAPPVTGDAMFALRAP